MSETTPDGCVIVRRDDVCAVLSWLEDAAAQLDTHNMNTRFTVEIDPPYLGDAERVVIDRLAAAERARAIPVELSIVIEAMNFFCSFDPEEVFPDWPAMQESARKLYRWAERELGMEGK